jgi:uncharacterized phage infection (PIP) family protein YhgE
VLEEMLAVLYRPLTDKMERMMSEIEATKAKVEALSAQIDQMQQRVVEDVEALKAQIAAHDIDAAVLEEINTGLDSISERVQAIDPDPANPPTGEPGIESRRASWRGHK